MRTKLAYVVVGNDSNIFIEQAFVSMWSAKYHNPDMPIAVVMDKDTESVLKQRPFYENFIKLTDEFVVKEFDSSVSGMIRSRWLKTKLREFLIGDFLYLDVDTIIAGKLDELDDLVMSVGFVFDFNVPFEKNRSANYYTKMLKDMFNITGIADKRYFNGGVYFSRDDETSRDFFRQWYENWNFCRNKGYYRDQLSLFKTSQENSAVVKELDGAYNCQLSENLQYFFEGKILHYYLSDKNMRAFSPFFGKDFYKKIKQRNDLSKSDKQDVLNCKACIEGPTNVLVGPDCRIYQSFVFRLLRDVYCSHTKVYNFLNFFAKFIVKMRK